MLLVLERHELTVTELCAVLQLPQSTVSRHLKTLLDAGWVVVAPRRHEPLLHARARRARPRDAAPLGAAARAGRPHAGRRSGRAPASRRARRGGRRSRRSSSRPPPASGIACARTCSDARRTCTRSPVCSIPRWIVGDLGCGTGQVAASLAPFVAARDRRRSIRRHAAGRPPPAARLPNVDVRRGELEALPIADGELDAATLLLVLHHLPDPVEALPKPRACCARADGC